jgi:ribosomal protein L37AE/L43A
MDIGTCPEEDRSAVMKRTESGWVCSECDEFLAESSSAANAALEEHTV